MPLKNRQRVIVSRRDLTQIIEELDDVNMGMLALREKCVMLNLLKTRLEDVLNEIPEEINDDKTPISTKSDRHPSGVSLKAERRRAASKNNNKMAIESQLDGILLPYNRKSI